MALLLKRRALIPFLVLGSILVLGSAGFGPASAYAQNQGSCEDAGYDWTSDAYGGTCTGQEGQGNPLVLTLTATPESIVQGSSSSLSWSWTRGGQATSPSNPSAFNCTINNGVGTVPAVGGPVSVSPSQGTDYLMLCTYEYIMWTDTIVTIDFADDASVEVTGTPPAPQPDLVGLVGSPANATANQPITLYGSARNDGQGASAGFPNIFQICDSNCATVNQAVAATRATALAPSGTQNVSGSFTPSAAGQLYYRTCVNMNTSWLNEATESNYGNNCSGWQYLLVGTQGTPDLAPGTAPTVTATLGQSVTVSGTVYNAGTAGTGAGFSNIMMTNLDGSGLSWNTVRSGAPSTGMLGTGATSAFSTTFPAGTFSAPGSYAYGYCVDFNTGWTGSVAESNESNNCVSGTIVIQPAPVAPDPTMTCSLSASPTSITAGGSSTLTWSSTNANSCTGGGFNTGGATNGSATVTPGSTTSYGLSCSGAGGATCNAAPATVTVGGGFCTNSATDLTITATPTRVRASVSEPAAVTVTWSATGVNGASASCAVTGPGLNWNSAVSASPSCSASGSATVNVTAQSTYTLTCAGQSESAVVNVVPNFIEL